MNAISLLRKSLMAAFLTLSLPCFSQTLPPIGTIPAGDSIIVVYDVTINTGATLISNQGSISGGNFSTFNTNDPKTASPGDPTLTVVQATTPGAALDFDGANDLVSVPHNPALNITTLTAECWIKTSVSKTPAGIVGKYVAADGWRIYQNGANLFASVNTPGASCTVNSSGQVINDGVYHHVAFAVDPSGGKIYIDGVLRGTGTWTATPGGLTNTAPLYIGYYTGVAGAEYFQGSIDEVRVWNRALCQGEIAANMNCEIATTGSGLLANYHFNQGTAGGNNAGVTTLNDASGNGYNGTLTNFALTGATSNWVAPGGVASGISCAAFLAPEINVQGNSVSIVDGDASPSTTDGTDFGNVNTGNSLQRTFTVQNTGTGNLTVSGIAMSGADAGMFTVGALAPASPVAAGNWATFTVTFAPTSPGLKTATVTIASNDCDEATYDFAVQGTGVALPSVLYVKAAATGANNGTSWTDAYTKLQDALAFAQANSGISQIWVAAGTYYPDEGGGKTDNDRNASFVMKSNLAIYGGFPATGNPVMADRNWKLNVSTLSGDVGTVGTNTDNSLRVVYGTNVTGVQLDGFVIRDGYNSSSSNGTQGAGIRFDNSTATTVANCIIRNNFTGGSGAGGAIFYSSPSTSFVNCLFFNNSAGFRGGGLFIEGCSPAFTNCTFANNTGSGGANAVWANQFGGTTSPVFTNCIFWNTQANSTAGIVNNQGSTIVANYSIVQDNYPGTGNINQNPLYVDAATGNLRLQTCSPAINTGNNNADLDGSGQGTATISSVATDLDADTRIVNGIIDMGAYEFQSGLPEINVQGNSVSIVDGDASPSTTDGTDFGNVNTGNSLQRTFTIQNTGTGNLTVSGIAMSGADAGMFTVGALAPASPIAAGNWATFTVTFAPTSPGLKAGTVHIFNNDCDEADYDFAIQGTGVAPLITYYPRTTATDLSLVSNWTDAVSGTGGGSPSNFTSPNQLFNVNGNVAKPAVLGAWTISGGSNLVLNNTDSLLFRPLASLTVGSGSTADFNGKPVTLKSTSAGTAFIGTITGSLTGASNVTVERYLSSLNNRAYRLLAPSVNTTTSIRQNWQEGVNNTTTAANNNPVPGYGTHITGSQSGANGFDATPTGQGSLLTLNTTTNAYEYVSNTNVSTLDAKKGYLLYLRGDRSIDLNSTANPLPSSNTTLRATGTLLTGTQTFTGTAANTGAGTGFNLLTNPYASAINWVSVFGANTGLAPAYTLFDPNIGSQGGYVTVNTQGVKSNAGSNATTSIQSGQAFFVQATGAAPTVTIQESHKSTSNNVDVFRQGAQTEIFTSSLYYTNAQGQRINADGVTSVYNNAYDTAVDENDAEQIANFDEDIAIRRSGHDLSIESRPLIDTKDTIPFVVARLQQRPYEWQFSASNFNAPGLTALLVDNFTGQRTAIALSGTTVIPFTVTGSAASSALNRFQVVFAQGVNTPLPISGLSVRAYQKNKDIQVEWTVQTEANTDRYEVETSGDARQFTKATTVTAANAGSTVSYNWLDASAAEGANYYRIKTLGKDGQAQYSKVVRVDMGKAAYGIALYPNPVSETAVTLSVNLPKGKYSVTLTNAAGQQVYKTEMVHGGGAATQTLPLRAGLAQGSYQLTVSEGTSRYVQQLIKQ